MAKDVEEVNQAEAVAAEDAASLPKQRAYEPPEIIRAYTPEQRAEVEKKLRRKIDVRLLPMIILMYILNYIDR